MKAKVHVSKMKPSLRPKDPGMATTVTITGSNTVPSYLQHNDYADIDFGPSGKITAGKVINIHFAPGKVSYDFEVCIEYGVRKKFFTRIYNVDSSFCNKRTDAYLQDEARYKAPLDRNRIDNQHNCNKGLWKKMDYNQRIAYNNVRSFDIDLIKHPKTRLSVDEWSTLSHNYAYLAAMEINGVTTTVVDA